MQQGIHCQPCSPTLGSLCKCKVSFSGATLVFNGSALGQSKASHDTRGRGSTKLRRHVLLQPCRYTTLLQDSVREVAQLSKFTTPGLAASWRDDHSLGTGPISGCRLLTSTKFNAAKKGSWGLGFVSSTIALGIFRPWSFRFTLRSVKPTSPPPW